MAELANCSRCGKVFAKQIRDICQDCFKQEEEDFRKVYSFLKTRTNREATIKEIVVNTGVDEDIIMKFIKENRLRRSQFPNLAYPCERCGKNIVTGRICSSCQYELEADLHRHDLEEQIEKKQKNKTDNPVYFISNKD
ncbi:hypothetical protein P5G51_006450 [Virgibacillus sp. 179-BFC.A HS]|uniref:Flagellar operon protein TIGR03826 n=1 Tax=Tigheibacillus jepli TaxID=3035914 RepID=A0ABU5CFJ8_9BACI|nr:TIGR03826 family flagellar region protein [Virgibacillus sp. 179-BFC.A HS]MDY0405084.1 hypothetical protein [Virgibacillus sp. 179-BFC.A HS]